MKYCIHHLAIFVIAFSLLSGGLFASPAIVSCDPPRDPRPLDFLLAFKLTWPDRCLAQETIIAPAKPAFMRGPVALPALMVRAREFSRRLASLGYQGAYC